VKIEALPVTSTLGAEIRGLDLSKPLPEDTASAVLNALFEHRVIFFRGQDITPAQHVAFSAQLGPVFSDFPPYLTTLDGQPEVTVLDGGSADSASFWHSDVSGSTEPPMASILVMREAPRYGGDTLWADMTAAYAALSDRMKSYLEGLRAVHGGPTDRTLRKLSPPTSEEPLDSGDSSRVSHPVVRTHPATGRKILFVNPGFTHYILGLPTAEADAVLEYLFHHQQQADFQCRWRWQQGDIAIWDNRAVHHYAIGDYAGMQRTIHRTTLEGDAPY
jgi:taurine dioxygenase